MKMKNFNRFILALLLVSAPVFSRDENIQTTVTGVNNVLQTAPGQSDDTRTAQPGGRTETAALAAQKMAPVIVTFSVTVPANTPIDDVIYIAGNLNFWDPGPGQAGTDGEEHDLAMQPTDDLVWQLDVELESGQALEYKYTRGSWSQVEKGSRGQELPNRRLTVPEGDSLQNDVVARWADTGSGVADHGEMPSSFRLEQYYPNPFNSGTVIRYRIPAAEHVRLSLVNLQGKTVATLVDQVQQAGAYELSYKSDLPSGVYFYRILAGNEAATRKLVLVR